MARIIRKFFRHSSRSEGFSLLENIISVAIFTVGILATSILFSQNMLNSHHSSKINVATNLAKNQLDMLKNTAYANIISGELKGADAITIDNTTYTISWDVINDEPYEKSKRVTVTVEWRDLMDTRGTKGPLLEEETNNQLIRIETIISRY